MTHPIMRFVVVALLVALPIGPAWAQEKKEGGSELHRRALEIMRARNEEMAKRAAEKKETPAPVEEKPKSSLPSFSEVAPKPKVPEPKVEEKPRLAIPERGTKVIEVKPEPARPVPPARPVNVKPEPKPLNPSATTYTVQSGDTLSSIAVKLYGEESKWTAIAKANPLADPIRLKVGQVLKLPNLAVQEQERAKEFERIKGEVATGGGSAPQTVTVEPGDSLGVISQRVYGKASLWKTIFEANRDQLDTPDEIKVGMKLKVLPKPGSKPAPVPAAAPEAPVQPAFTPESGVDPVETPEPTPPADSSPR